jgi:hypothetical protein
VIQLVLSVVLGALGGLVVAREASLAMAGSGIWCGAIAGIVGALGIMNIKSAHTGFLAVSLIAVASSTLGMALCGIGLVRDINLAKNEQVILSYQEFLPFSVFDHEKVTFLFQINYFLPNNL